ncbi:phytanoyl-CoA dioxygenase family protein [Calothrix rhizosoleniae]|uniref:phytanoyl-CoA dioxygenase family protein n=1 Tax=Calothrix rhizosoleniae TaxID=888997 RepID=UPI001178BA17|nr:phytanoyl-CoA dioxygenase family protein [Calothrix rhizosoleniae]
MTSNILTTSYSSAFSKVIKRLLSNTEDREYAIQRLLTRFPLNRKAYSTMQNLWQQLDNSAAKKNLKIRDKSIFDHVNTITYAEKIRQESVAFGLNLPSSIVEEVYEYACKAPCYGTGRVRDEGEFAITEVKDGYLRDKYPVALAEFNNSTLMGCEAIEKLVQDPLLLQIARDYLNYWPTKIERYMSWTLASKLSEQEQKRLNEPIVYHYDLVPGYNSVRIYFYITDIDASSGPHVMIKGSHEKKPIAWMLAPCQQPDSEVYKYYGQENEIVIEGKKGLGFFQDPYCFHKATTPVTGNRLLLQIRYY